jgi:hypothetical protein
VKFPEGDTLMFKKTPEKFFTRVAHAAVQRAALLLAEDTFKPTVPLEVHQCEVYAQERLMVGETESTRRYGIRLEYRNYTSGDIGYIFASIVMRRVVDHLDKGTLTWEPVEADWISGSMVMRHAIYAVEVIPQIPTDVPTRFSENPRWMLRKFRVTLEDHRSDGAKVPHQVLSPEA